VLPFLFFLTPIVYPLEAVPAGFQVVAWMNPIAHVVEDARRTAIFALAPKWRALAINCALSGTLAFAGFLFFMRSKRHFHDAL
jgi:lipopolysaccharide transport system permease protein